jgi:hypothetical protein
MAKKKKDSGKVKPKIKKRPVGRPKKRGRKKNYYKSRKKKNVAKSTQGFGGNMSYNRVRALLWNTHKDDFASYHDFISNEIGEDGKRIHGTSIVSKVYAECKSMECSDEDILAIYYQFKRQDKDGTPPIIPDSYYEPRPYFELVTSDLWDGLDDRLWVYSPMLLSSPDFFLGILGEDRCIDKDNQVKNTNKCDIEKGDKLVNGKKEGFTPFVRYCNKFQSLGIYKGSEEVPHIKFVGKTEDDLNPYWSDENNRWEIQIVPCTPFGDINSYDFDPDEVDADVPLEPIELKPKKTVEPSKDIDNAIILEQEKRKTLEQQEKTALAQTKLEEKKAIADITAQWRKGEINTAQMERLISLIKS